MRLREKADEACENVEAATRQKIDAWIESVVDNDWKFGRFMREGRRWCKQGIGEQYKACVTKLTKLRLFEHEA